MTLKRGARAKIPTSAYPQVADMLKRGMNHAEIARVFGVHQSTITRLVPKLPVAASNPVDTCDPDAFVASFDNKLACLRGIHEQHVKRDLDLDWCIAAMTAYRRKFRSDEGPWDD